MSNDNDPLKKTPPSKRKRESRILSNPRLRAILLTALKFNRKFRPVELRKALDKMGYSLEPSELNRDMKLLDSIGLFKYDGSPKSEYDRFVPYKGYKMRFRRILLGFRIVDEHFEAHRLYKETSEIRKDPAFTQKTFQNFLRLIVLWKELLPEQQENVIQWFVDFHMGS